MTFGWPRSGVLAGGLTDQEWSVARVARANVLLVAPNDLAAKIVDALRTEWPQPIAEWKPGSQLVLPPVEHTGTLILQDVGALTRDEQRSLCDWLEVAAGRACTLTTSREPLFPLVEAGAFSTTLYYRLNVLSFQLTDCAR